MRLCTFGSTSALAFTAVLAGAGSACAQMTCESLTGLSIPGTTIIAATPVTPGTTLPSGLGSAYSVAAPVPFCRVQATLTPVLGSQIQMEVWLPPAASWSGRFQGTGNGGLSGSIYTIGLGPAVARGDAAANSDQGHEAPDPAAGVADASFIVGHPQSFIDFGFRATHLMTVIGKAITTAYYGRAPSYAYFNGCSSGGRQALKEAQTFPDDYNGILAGDPANNWVNLNFDQVYEVQVNEAHFAGTIQPAQYSLINQAVLAQCGSQDGVKDPGFVADPLRCKFDPGVLQCQSGDSSQCLTAPQVETARKVYAGPIDQRTGLRLFPGFEPGSETLWGAITPTGTPGGFAIADSYFKYFVFGDPNFNYMTLNYGSDVTAAELQDGGVVSALDADLSPFASHGGKLIQYHGWADTTISPRSSTDYYSRVAMGMAGNNLLRVIDTVSGYVPTQALEEVASFYRLFMVPGMGHCSGGPGPDAFGQTFGLPGPSQDPQHDVLSALEQWVEQGTAPQRIVATKYNNDNPGKGIAFSRPLCPYPQVAQYSGQGDQSSADSFSCVTPPGLNKDGTYWGEQRDWRDGQQEGHY
jgi:feruloyl esterase